MKGTVDIVDDSVDSKQAHAQPECRRRNDVDDVLKHDWKRGITILSK